MRKRAAAEDVARMIQGDDQFFAPNTPGREEGDL